MGGLTVSEERATASDPSEQEVAEAFKIAERTSQWAAEAARHAEWAAGQARFWMRRAETLKVLRHGGILEDHMRGTT